MPKYNHTNLLQFRTKVANLLGDPDMIFWKQEELNSYIKESLLTFGAVSSFWKNQVQIHTEENKTIYDIFVDSDDTTLIEPEITYNDLLDWINKILVEDLPTTPSDFISETEIFSLISKKYNSYQLLTNLVLSNEEYNVPPQNNIVKLKDDVLEIVRVIFIDDTSPEPTEYIIEKDDEASITHNDYSTLSEQGMPLYYSNVYNSPNEINLYPTPNVHGILKIITIRGLFDITDGETILPLPNNLTPYIKMGVMQDIFSKDGLFNDPARMAYYKSRWEEGIIVGNNYASILTARSNGLYIPTDSLKNLNRNITLVRSGDAPNVLGLAGFNIFSIDNIPDTVVNSIQLNLNINATLPSEDDNFIEIELDYIEILASYVVHLAQQKCGAAYLNITQEAKNNFLKLSVDHNIKLRQRGITYEIVAGISKREENDNPRLVKEEAA